MSTKEYDTEWMKENLSVDQLIDALKGGFQVVDELEAEIERLDNVILELGERDE